MQVISRIQKNVCDKYNAEFSPPKSSDKLGISLNVRDGVIPINGMRNIEENGTSGWYIWAGEEFSHSPNFFQPLHHEHLVEWCPDIIRFMALPPGWRFLIADGYEDVWFDESLISENPI